MSLSQTSHTCLFCESTTKGGLFCSRECRSAVLSNSTSTIDPTACRKENYTDIKCGWESLKHISRDYEKTQRSSWLGTDEKSRRELKDYESSFDWMRLWRRHAFHS
ncbi:uncharacterized protein BO97DRAFT_29968 [Aspergillus homomorphus CBS 101889]|uniref:Uncharacterized protein n=1 Tax=Aspergillus homomorphus (strain CBS 101889) TaxID=1450537 RepID=A0A395HGF7_ASPHC|nr:hypothetical protein BO97DRAFT_29968 [Aspergillus homomorphus CBS 101889]RAL06553.1 hypothetical protein BO97DRAFT_29968 [Aspergillus homomorphus CBS 101889]